MAIQPINFVVTTLRAPVAPTDTQLQLAAGTGYLFNALTSGNYVYITVNDSTTAEVMKYTSSGSVVNDTITVVRGQDNTTAKAFPSGACVAIQWDVAQVNDFVTQIVLNMFGTISLPINTILTNGMPTTTPPQNIIYAIDPNTGQMWFYNGGVGAWLYINSNSVQVAVGPPSGAPAGNVVWSIDTATSILYYWNGTIWTAMTGGYYQEINSRQYNDATGVVLTKGTDNIIGGLTGMVNLGTIAFPVVINYQSNYAISARIVIPESGAQINELLFPHSVICRFNACFVGDRDDSTVPVHGALTIFHAADSLEWQQNFFVPGDDVDNSLNRNVSASLSTDPLLVVPTDYFDLNLTIYDSGAAYGGFTLKQLCFAAQVTALGSI